MRNGLLFLGAAVVLGFGVSGDAQTSGPTLKKVSPERQEDGKPVARMVVYEAVVGQK